MVLAKNCKKYFQFFFNWFKTSEQNSDHTFGGKYSRMDQAKYVEDSL